MDDGPKYSPTEKFILDARKRVVDLKKHRDEIVEVLTLSNELRPEYKVKLIELNKKIIKMELQIAAFENTYLGYHVEEK